MERGFTSLIWRNMRMAIALMFMLLLSASCNHIWEDQEDCCTPRHEVAIKLKFDLSFLSTLKHYVRTEEVRTFRVTICAYRVSSITRTTVRSLVNSSPDETFNRSIDVIDDEEHTVNLSLTPGEWILLVWADFTDPVTQFEYYNCTDFSDIHINETMGHTGGNDYRDAYSGSANINIGTSKDDDEEVIINMTRPMAKYRIVTTDLNEFMEMQLKSQSDSNEFGAQSISAAQKEIFDFSKYTIRILYTGYMPSAYNIFYDTPSNAITEAYYDGKITKISDSEAEIGFDYIFVDTNDAFVSLAIGVYDNEGNLISRTPSYDIPLQRGNITTVLGKFLTTASSSSGNGSYDFIGVDPTFSDTLIIQL
jgi:hypothetical protein